MELKHFKQAIINTLKPVVDRVTKELATFPSSLDGTSSRIDGSTINLKHSHTMDGREVDDVMMTRYGSRFGTRIKY